MGSQLPQHSHGFCRKARHPCPPSHAKPYSTDRNLLHISFEGGVLEDPWHAPPEEMFDHDPSLQDALDEPEDIEPSPLSKGTRWPSTEKNWGRPTCWPSSTDWAGKHGIGRIDIVENRYVGMKSRGVYETPGGTILRQAHMGMESLTMDREVMHLRDSLIPQYAKHDLQRLLVFAGAGNAAGPDRQEPGRMSAAMCA
jgi:argininosuccinate synthase